MSDLPTKVVTVSTFARIEVQRPRFRGLSPTHCRVDYPVQIRVADDSVAPTAFKARFKGGEFAYRLHDGVLYRPVVDIDGSPAGFGSEGLELDAINARRTRPGLDRINAWADDPFARAALMRGEEPVVPVWNLDAFADVFGTPQVDPRRDVVSAGASLANDLIEIGGVIHIRAKDPVWAIFAGAFPHKSVDRIALWMPDIPVGKGYAPPLAVFAFDRLEEARAAAAALNAYAADLKTRSTGEMTAVATLGDPEGAIDAGARVPDTDVEGITVNLTAQSLDLFVDHADTRDCSSDKLRWIAANKDFARNAFQEMEAFEAHCARLRLDLGLARSDARMTVLDGLASVPEIWMTAHGRRHDDHEALGMGM